MFKKLLDINKLKEDERVFKNNLLNDKDKIIAATNLISLRLELNYEKLVSDEELNIIKEA